MGRKELTPSERSRICELHTSANLTPSRIHKLHPEWPISTIKSTIRRETIRGKENVSRPRSGRPRALTDEQRDHIYDLKNHTNPGITNQELLEELDYAVKKRTLQRLLEEMSGKK